MGTAGDFKISQNKKNKNKKKIHPAKKFILSRM